MSGLLVSMTRTGARDHCAWYVHRAPGWGWKTGEPPAGAILVVVAWTEAGDALVLAPSRGRHLQAADSLESTGTIRLIGIYKKDPPEEDIQAAIKELDDLR